MIFAFYVMIQHKWRLRDTAWNMKCNVTGCKKKSPVIHSLVITWQQIIEIIVIYLKCGEAASAEFANRMINQHNLMPIVGVIYTQIRYGR